MASGPQSRTRNPKHRPTLTPTYEDDGGDEFLPFGPPQLSRQRPYQVSSSGSRYGRDASTSLVPFPKSHDVVQKPATRGPRSFLARLGSRLGPADNFDARYHTGNDSDSSDEEQMPYYSDHAIGDSELEQLEPATPAQRERLEWQTMLRSVLDGDVFGSEKKRIAGTDPDKAHHRTSLVQDIWFTARARLRCRDPEEERKRFEHRRLRLGEGLVEDVLAFRYDPALGEPAQQINALLRRLDALESFYPTYKELATDKVAFAETVFRDRIEAMISWTNLAGTISHHYRLLQKWTGSPTLDVMAPYTATEVPLTTHSNRRSSEPRMNGGDVMDESTFVERVMKESSLVQIFKKRALLDVYSIVERANEVRAQYLELYKEMDLPTHINDIRELLVFPTKLMQAALRVQLDYANKVKDLDVMQVDQMMEDFTISIREACQLKRSYETLMRGGRFEHWLDPEYDTVVLQAVSTFFQLLQKKLKSVSGMRGGAHLRETEFLDGQWDLLDDVASLVTGGSVLVAEQLCTLVHRLIVRLTDSFEHQVHNPMVETTNSHDAVTSRSRNGEIDDTHADLIGWYNRLLENVRLRYRKLRRFTKFITNRFSNSADFGMELLNIDVFIHHLVASDHFLVYSEEYQEQGTYIVANSSLKDHPEVISQLLQKAFMIEREEKEEEEEENGDGEGEEAASITEGLKEKPNDTMKDALKDPNDIIAADAGYILVFRPAQRFFWNGEIMWKAEVSMVDLDLKDLRMKLIADGGHSQLALAKKQFAKSFTAAETKEDAETEVELENGLAVAGAEIPTVGTIPCLVEQQAHLPTVNKELRKIVKATNRLAAAIVESVHSVRNALRGVYGYQELLENWFLFASEHAVQVNRYLEHATRLSFNRSLARLAISWVAFICDDCDATDRKTFRWAVNALEFARYRVSNNVILHLPSDEFALLRKKVAICMSLLIRHFDILGARSSNEAKKERDRLEELKRQQALDAKLRDEDDSFFKAMFLEEEDEGERSQTAGFVATAALKSVRLFRDRLNEQFAAIDANRLELDKQERLIGRVLDDTKLEDRTLYLLAASHSNVSIRWKQGSFIGGGAFGSVYLASNMDTGGLMAVKEIRFQDVAGMLPNLYKSIKDELSVMEILRHPNIVEYYGIEVHRDRVYIFEEYCKGGSLASILESGRIEEEAMIQIYAIQMLEGLNYLHSQGVVHRDIKPDNILLDHKGVIKFVDFGAAKILARNRTLTLQRNKGSTTLGGMGANGNSLTGTPMYMSPEVIKNDQRGRHGAMDIWSMGCVLLECATGHKPWSNLDNEWAIMFHIGVATKHPPLPEPHQLSPLGIAFIRDCLMIDPMRRPSAAELLEHPWILLIKQTLDEEDLPVDPDNAIVAKQAAAEEAAEIEAMNLASPAISEMTPTAENPRPSFC